MKHFSRTLRGIIFAVLLLSWVARGDERKQVPIVSVPAHQKEDLVNPPDNPDLPNILILGDSISIGYTVDVRKYLDGQADVFRPTTNCMHSGYGALHVEECVEGKKWDAIHFNFGIWDTHYLYEGQMVADLSKYKREDLTRRYTTEQYLQNLQKIVGVLQKTGAALIWASTTPLVTEGKDTELLLARNNREARSFMKQEDITIDDLHALAIPNLKKWQSEDGCHFTQQGYGELAKQVASTLSIGLRKKVRHEASK